MSVNIPMLRGRMIQNGYNIVTLANRIGIDRSTLYRRIQDEGLSFTVGEIHKIIDTLQLSKEDASCIFLFNNSQKRE